MADSALSEDDLARVQKLVDDLFANGRDDCAAEIQGHSVRDVLQHHLTATDITPLTLRFDSLTVDLWRQLRKNPRTSFST